MSVTRDVPTPPQRVWEVLADGWKYANWVVGASRIRAVDESWPATGARIWHSVGPWPLAINDETVVERCVPVKELALRAKTWPVGEARIRIQLTDIPGGCRVEMDEIVIAGPPKWLPQAVQRAAVAPRNRECLWRLANIAEHKQPNGIQ
jgi:uncharacterized protein YndB with AHSA1/START domain